MKLKLLLAILVIALFSMPFIAFGASNGEVGYPGINPCPTIVVTYPGVDGGVEWTGWTCPQPTSASGMDESNSEPVPWQGKIARPGRHR